MNKEKILEMFESISYVIVQSLEEKDQTEEKIEAELFYEAKNNERFSSLSEKDIKSIVRNILIA